MTDKPSTMREFNVVVERDEAGWYVASVPALPGCHTQARSLDELMSRIREAIEAYLEAGDAPAPLEFVGVQRVSVAA
jgi:predicted RNase H-like HicB family nuclease